MDLTIRLDNRWYVLILLSLIYTFNIADRYVVSTVLEPIRIELHLTDSGVAFLTGVPLALFYCGFGLVIAWLADRFNRRNILAASVIIWSAFTMACGLSIKYWHLLVGRMGVGIGEAGGTPTSCTILADSFPASRRAMAFAVFALGAPLGAWVGADLAAMAAHAYGWRAAFVGLGAPGILLGILAFTTLKEPARGQLDTSHSGASASFLEVLKVVWMRRAAFHLIMAAGVCSLWGWGLVWWLPAFLMRTHHLDVASAGAITGPIHLIGGSAATLASVWLFAQPWMAAPKRVLLFMTGVIAVCTIPSIIAIQTDSLATARVMLWLFIPSIYTFTGPCLGLLQNIVSAPMRAMATALSGLSSNLFNLVVAPQGVGLISDWLAANGSANSLRVALLILAPTGFWAAFHLYRAATTEVNRA